VRLSGTRINCVTDHGFLKFGRARLPEFEMKFTIRVEIATDWNETENFEISEIARQYCELDQSKIGLSLAEGKDVLHKVLWLE
jgi:hypothetical protein